MVDSISGLRDLEIAGFGDCEILGLRDNCCAGKIISLYTDQVVAKVFSDLYKRRLAIVRPDTSTLGDASFSVSFVQKVNDAMAENPTAVQLQGKRKTQHRKAYERPAGLRPSYQMVCSI